MVHRYTVHKVRESGQSCTWSRGSLRHRVAVESSFSGAALFVVTTFLGLVVSG